MADREQRPYEWKEGRIFGPAFAKAMADLKAMAHTVGARSRQECRSYQRARAATI